MRGWRLPGAGIPSRQPPGFPAEGKEQSRSLLGNESGFTLLEVIIALAIMVLAFASILMVESNAINGADRARQLNVVAMLAKNKMVETEYKFEGKVFDEYKKEESGTFDAPYQDYRWSVVIKEIQFPNLNFGAMGGGSQGSGGDQGSDVLNLITKLVTKFLSKATREVDVTIFYKRGPRENSFLLSTYWVNLGQEFEASE